jgi:hypothetical protein
MSCKHSMLLNPARSQMESSTLLQMPPAFAQVVAQLSPPVPALHAMPSLPLAEGVHQSVCGAGGGEGDEGGDGGGGGLGGGRGSGGEGEGGGGEGSGGEGEGGGGVGGGGEGEGGGGGPPGGALMHTKATTSPSRPTASAIETTFIR